MRNPSWNIVTGHSKQQTLFSYNAKCGTPPIKDKTTLGVRESGQRQHVVITFIIRNRYRY